MSHMKTGIRVHDAMTRRPFHVTSSTTLAECASLMKERKVGSLLVKDEEQVKGILTEQDIVRKAVAASTSPGHICASDVMEPNLVTIAGHEDIFDAINLMKKHDIRHLPVVTGKDLDGFLTLKDILKIEPELFELLVDRIEIREEELKPIFRLKPNEGICQACGEYADELETTDGHLTCAQCR